MQTAMPRVTDYWDERVGTIDRMARELRDVPDKDAVLGELHASVARHTAALPDNLLAKAVVAVADDLYKAACAIDRWDLALAQYLAATARPFFEAAAGRTLLLHYVVDNTFDDLIRVRELFSGWFDAAGIVFACPQQLALVLMEHDGDVADELLPRYIDEARYLAGQLVERCREESRHFVFLDADSVDGSFDAALADRGKPGVVTVFRNEAPLPRTDVRAWFPA